MKTYFISILLVVLISSMGFVNFAYSGVEARLKYDKKYAGAFKATLEVNELKSEYDYILCMNGYVKHQSNQLLIDACEVYEKTGEGFCNFDTVTTDENGTLTLDIEEELPIGKYKVKFLIKDAENFIVVWKKEPITFEVTEKEVGEDKK